MRFTRHNVVLIGHLIFLAQFHRLVGKPAFSEDSLHIGSIPRGGSHSVDRKIPKNYGNFERVIDPVQLDSTPIKVAKWKSRKTGLTVVWADVEGPRVSGHIVVATELFNDSGIPHTLEHLVFLGSENYPYKGILDTLANRALAEGTQATTTTTHTAYKVTTASPDGFLRLLPIYLDHILYPTITPEGFTTEVYHINGKGEEAGVVFSEMQGSEDALALHKKRLLYPPTSAYRSDTHGLLDALRVLPVEQIRAYHKSYYQPHNLQLIVSGKVDPFELLEVLNSQVEPILVKHGQDKQPKNWKRPFLETSSKGGAQLDKDRTVEVELAQEDESSGTVQISWVGPKTNKFLLQAAIQVLFIYLTKPVISPLAKKFVEIASPLSTDISYGGSDAEKRIWTLYFEGVPSEHLSTIGDLVKKALFEESLALDMNHLKIVIENLALQVTDEMEVFPHENLSTRIISNFLYGVDSDLVSDFQTGLQRYKVLAGWTEDQWSTIFKEWLVDRPSLCLIGKPSAKLSEKEESNRIKIVEDNRRKYGPDGLKKLAERLARAQDINNRPYPDHIIQNFPIPDVKSIPWIDVDIANSMQKLNTPLQFHVDSKDSANLPYFVQFNHIKSNFISIYINFSPPNLPPELFALLPPYIGSFFSLPIKRKDGTHLSYDKVARQLAQQTVAFSIRMGSPITQNLEISMKVEKKKYDDAISWLRDLLYGSVFDVDRLRITATKALQKLPTTKRDGNTISGAVFCQMVYDSQRSPTMSDTIFQHESNLPIFLEKLNSKPKSLINQMEKLRTHLLKASSMRIGVSGDIYSLEKPKSSWLKHFASVKAKKLDQPLFINQVLTREGANPSGKVVLVSMPSIESTYAYHVARGPQGFDHPDAAALSVAITVLEAMESYLWKAIRGTGLAYSVSITSDFEGGHVFLKIKRSPDSSEAFFAAGKVLRDLVEKKLKFDSTILESAKISSVFSAAEGLDNPQDAAYETLSNVAMKGISKDAFRQQLENAKSVTMENVLKMIKKYLLPIFDSKTSLAAIASTSTKSNEISEKLKSKGFEVELREL